MAGFDWGARTADIVAALWPERCSGLVSVSGYLIGSQAAGKAPLPPEAELQWWYQYYFATERGRAGYDKYRRDFAKLIWQTASPKWDFDDATFDRSAASFDNPDHVAIVIHNYRWRLGLAEGEAAVRRPGATARRGARHHRAHHHPRGRRQRRAPPGAERLRRRSSPGRTRTGRSRAASGTTCPRKRRTRSPTPFWRCPSCREIHGWRRRESNPRPPSHDESVYKLVPGLSFARVAAPGRATSQLAPLYESRSAAEAFPVPASPLLSPAIPPAGWRGRRAT